jgi:large subunit ribosomal protein L29
VAELNKYIGDGSKHVKLHDLRNEIRGASEADLQDILNDVQKELLEQRTQAMLQQIPNPMRIRQLKKLVARVNTELSARERKAAA